ncbi:MAG: FAD-binding oxidoreductase [Alphaproteobacteria bacterium]
MPHPILSPDVKLRPYWWDEAPRPVLDEAPLPREIDAVVVGAGYSGLSAALTLARAGRGVLVCDAEDAGHGCSSRNGGQLGFGLKPGLDGLGSRFGTERGTAMFRESMASLDYLGAFIEREQIACHFQRRGRFIGAHRPGHYEALARRLETYRTVLGVEAHAVPRGQQHAEMGTDLYFGGGVIESHAALQPALYHFGLLDRARSAGATVAARTPVTGIERGQGRFVVTTTRGPVACGNVVVATNRYTRDRDSQPAFPRRVIPIGSYMIATEPIERALMDRLMPKDRVNNDTRRVVLYYRASPDRTRIVFGGRVALGETDAAVSGPRLHAVMAGIFPELRGVRVSHSWLGFVAYTFDHLPHIGLIDGIHYAMGYCGSGVAMGSYLGHKVGLKVLGAPEGRTAFDDLPFETRPLYDGTPWFLAGAVLWYRLMDRYGPDRGPR